MCSFVLSWFLFSMRTPTLPRRPTNHAEIKEGCKSRTAFWSIAEPFGNRKSQRGADGDHVPPPGKRKSSLFHALCSCIMAASVLDYFGMCSGMDFLSFWIQKSKRKRRETLVLKTYPLALIFLRNSRRPDFEHHAIRSAGARESLCRQCEGQAEYFSKA